MSMLDQFPQLELHSANVLRNRHYNLDLHIHEVTSLPLEQLIIIIALMADEQPKEALEIGTDGGCTTSWMSRAVPNCIVHTLDLPLDWRIGTPGPQKTDESWLAQNRKAIGQRFRDKPEEFPNIRQHYGDSALIDFKQFGSPTFFFIDGSHNFDYVVNDTKKCVEASGGHGVILWHDVAHGHDEVIRGLAHIRSTMGLQIYRLGYGIGWCRF